jgi:TonB dependent receptor/CarboxypepD_reg-like domain/TonB-dependent Receptor Plug Domain
MRWLLLGAFLLGMSTLAAQNIALKGYVYDTTNGEPLVGANIIDSLHKTGVSSNNFGFFNLKIPHKSALLKISYTGYKAVYVLVSQDTTLTVSLEPGSLATVEVRASKTENELSSILLPIEKLNRIPTIGGEKDIIKALVFLPGVATGIEGQSSIFVRGGGSDQNLFILDGSYLYNTGHLFNFVSLFNPDAVKIVAFYKENFPAHYGGRLASVLDVSLREGDKNRFHGKFDIGFLSTKLTLEGPLVKNKTSFIASLRRSYFDILSIGKEQKFYNHKQDSFGKYSFNDFNFKISHNFSSNSKLFLNYYSGYDFYKTGNKLDITELYEYSFQFRNQTASARFNTNISPSLFLQTSIGYTSSVSSKATNYFLFDIIPATLMPPFKPAQFIPKDTTTKSEKGDIEDIVAKVLLDIRVSNTQKVSTGIEVQQHKYRPFEIYQNKKYTLSGPFNATEYALFAEYTAHLPHDFRLITGLRYSGFINGASNFNNFEPRVSIIHTHKRFGNTHIGFSKMVQYSHALLRNGDLITRLTWIPSDNDFLPEIGHQYNIGWKKATASVDFSLETFYKTLKNQTYFQASTEQIEDWRKYLLANGQGNTYGFELMIHKRWSKVQSNLSYTLSWSNRQFSNLNNGDWFPFVYDRRHNISFSNDYKISKNWHLSVLWSYFTGKRYTIPIAQVNQNILNGLTYYVYGSLNNYVIPATHRLDLSLDYEKTTLRKNIIGINFTLYNAYNRHNPFALLFDKYAVYDSQGKTQIFETQINTVSMFPILPSLSLFYKF